MTATRDAAISPFVAWAKARLSPNMSKALEDYSAGFQRHVLWTSLAWFEIKVKYRRSVLGPFWITLSTAIAIATIGPIYARLMGSSMDDYFAYLATSIVLWNFLSAAINDNCSSFIAAEGMLKDVKLPLLLFILKDLYRNIILLLHNSVILLILMYFFTFIVNIPLFLLCFVIVVLNLFWVGVVLAIICTRFRDVGQIITSLVQVAFFLTPVMWKPSMLGAGGRHLVVDLNPFYYLIDLFRSPLLTGSVDIGHLLICTASAILGNAFAFWFFSKKRARVAYWL